MESKAETLPAGWIAILEESEAELDAGQSVLSETLHRELRESISRLEAKALTRLRKASTRC
jgi:hypothetical protein